MLRTGSRSATTLFSLRRALAGYRANAPYRYRRCSEFSRAKIARVFFFRRSLPLRSPPLGLPLLGRPSHRRQRPVRSGNCSSSNSACAVSAAAVIDATDGCNDVFMSRERPLIRTLVCALVAALCCAAARAEVKEVRIAQQFGVAYLPLMAIKKLGLIEKHAQSAGQGAIKVTWTTFSSGADMNTALIAGTLDFASGGVGPVLQIWGRTRGTIDVRGV